jgi:thiol-disulfide isomerase/thioredoxin
MLNPPVLVERDHTSMLIAWDRHDEAVHYELQLNITHDTQTESAWTSLSSTLKSNFVKKKNLVDGTPCRFRVRFANKDGIWCSWSQPSESFYVLASAVRLMDIPEFFAHDGNSVTIRWKEISGAKGYHIRYRDEANISNWEQIHDTLKSTIAKKKGLDSQKGYYFAVVPVFGEGHEERWAYSLSAGPFKTAVLSAQMSQMLPSQILAKDSTGRAGGHKLVKSLDVLAGKHVAIYFSAHWCGPCRNFTPRLVELYHQIKAQNKNMEIIFCSADHDEDGFLSYYASMPWLAVEFEDPKREQFMGLFKVSGIPRLCILSPTGRIIEDNAAGRSLTMSDVDNWLKITN